MLTPGIKGEKNMLVDGAATASFMGSGSLSVFATPAMVALMEGTAMESVAAHLSEGEGTVGTAIHVEHISATPVGMQVRCESELVQLDGRKLVFEIKAFDEAGLIGTATHSRFIIDNARFMAKAQAKLRSAPTKS